MRGFLKFVLFAAVLVGLLVAVLLFVVLPAVAGPLLTGAVRDLGVQSEQLDVTLEEVGPGIASGVADRVRVRAEGVEIATALVGRVDLVFEDVSLLRRTFQRVEGSLEDVRVDTPAGTTTLTRIDVTGPADAAEARARFDRMESEALIGLAAERSGFRADRVALLDDGSIHLQSRSGSVRGRLVVTAGALAFTPDGAASVLLLQPDPSDPWQLTDVAADATGITVTGVVDARRLAQPST